jgi:tetraacyldisaccharide 4'-kinase
VKRPWALPLVPLYAATVAAKDQFYTRQLLPVLNLRRPVISVGSLSSGGAGKTPFVLALAQLLEHHGISVDVLSRGYGRTVQTIGQVQRDGDAREFGDEPLELARAGLQVFVGADRFAAGTLAERTLNAKVHLLDDGFQHRRLGRSLDIALLTAEDANDSLLPAGNLRECISALHRAHVIAVRREELSALQATLAQHPHAAVWVIERSLHLPDPLPLRPIVFCAIARPAGLVAMLRARGVEPVRVILRRDHHAWTANDWAMLAQAARETKADGFITTAKDEVKLPAVQRRQLASIAPVTVARLRVSFADPESVFADLTRVLKSAAGPAIPSST